MKTVKIIVFIILLALFIGLIVLLVMTYKDYRHTQDYMNFVTDSANGYISEVEETNNILNSLDYDEEEQDVSLLKNRLEEMKQSYNNMNNDRSTYAVPSGGDELDSQLNLFLAKANELNSSLEVIILSIENLEEKEVFQVKFDDYIQKSSSLQGQSEVLGDSLDEFMNNYSKFDLKSIKDGI